MNARGNRTSFAQCATIERLPRSSHEPLPPCAPSSMLPVGRVPPVVARLVHVRAIVEAEAQGHEHAALHPRRRVRVAAGAADRLHVREGVGAPIGACRHTHRQCGGKRWAQWIRTYTMLRDMESARTQDRCEIETQSAATINLGLVGGWIIGWRTEDEAAAAE
eukprot:3989047-Prymnesium_polylepis.1